MCLQGGQSCSGPAALAKAHITQRTHNASAWVRLRAYVDGPLTYILVRSGTSEGPLHGPLQKLYPVSDPDVMACRASLTSSVQFSGTRAIEYVVAPGAAEMTDPW